jgi:predicted metallo-beta-lactamase superfamily hydrolase
LRKFITVVGFIRAMRITPISFDSMGVRGMGCFVSAGNYNIFIDPGANVVNVRYGLPPSNIEIKTLDAIKRRIYALLQDTQIVVISHYDDDHFIQPQDINAKTCYRNKIVLAKDRRSKCNFNQRKSGKDFELFVRGVCKSLTFVDGKEMNFNNVKIKFSQPVEHGVVKTNQGYVLMTTIDDGTKQFMHCSDVQGPVLKKTAELIVEENPDIIAISGPPINETSWYFSKVGWEKAKDNLKYILTNSNVETIMLDHYLVREINFKKEFRDVYEFAEKQNKKVLTAAEFLGQPIRQLEAKRRFFWDDKNNFQPM